MTKYEFHPLSQMFPLMNPADHADFTANIKQVGQLIPIVLLDGQILDGRNRYNACVKLEIEPQVVSYTKDQARDYVIGVNLFRRHYTKQEQMHYLRTLIDLQDELGMTNKDVAKATGMSVATIKREKHKNGSNEPLVSEQRKKVEREDLVDKLGVAIPEGDASYYWLQTPRVSDGVVKLIHDAGLAVKNLSQDDLMWKQCDLQSVLTNLRSAYHSFKGGLPAYLCTECEGRTPRLKFCKFCFGTGLLGTFRWDNCGDDKHSMKRKELEQK